MKIRKLLMAGMTVCLLLGSLTGCRKNETDINSGGSLAKTAEKDDAKESTEKNNPEDNAKNAKDNAEGIEGDNSEASLVEKEPIAGLKYESSEDAVIDFSALTGENEDVYAWLCVPRTEIDIPVLQSGESDSYYQKHNAFKEADPVGAAYTEMATMRDFCDFNTVIRGSGGSGGIFEELTEFEDKEFFDSNETIYVYLDGNILTYEVIAAFRSDEDSPIREYDFFYPEECRSYIDRVFNEKLMGKLTREGFEGLGENNFLITLYIDTPDDNGKHLCIVGVLINDAAGTINRSVSGGDEIDIFSLLGE